MKGELQEKPDALRLEREKVEKGKGGHGKRRPWEEEAMGKGGQVKEVEAKLQSQRIPWKFPINK